MTDKNEGTSVLSSQDERAYALGAEWMRREAGSAVEDYCSDMPDLAGHGHSVGLRDVILMLPTPTPADLLAEALRLPEVRALVEACRDVIAEREINGPDDCGCDMCMYVDRMSAALPKGGA